MKAKVRLSAPNFQEVSDGGVDYVRQFARLSVVCCAEVRNFRRLRRRRMAGRPEAASTTGIPAEGVGVWVGVSAEMVVEPHGNKDGNGDSDGELQRG